MGFYINPENQTKEEWLLNNARPTSSVEVEQWDFSEETEQYPICLIDNGPFTAAAVLYNHREIEAFTNYQHDPRPRFFFLANKKDLEYVVEGGLP